MAVWQIKGFDKNKAKKIKDKFDLSWPVAVLLVQRGIDSEEKVRKFLWGGLADLIPPYRMQGMKEAVMRIKQAAVRGEKVVIYGDYDVDGICSTVIMLRCLEKLGIKVDYYIPDRFAEGYGMNETAISKLAEKGYDLLISVDCGITSVEEASLAAELGMDIIITDHHTPPAELPRAEAVINPKLDGEEDIFNLAGAGVVFKLAEALIGEEAYNFIELAALATVADIMPLTGDNRIIVKEGLQRLPLTANKGLQALLEKTGLREKGEITPWHLGFIIAPRINSAGRLYKADLALELFLSDDEEECREKASRLCQLNNERKNLEESICKEAILKVENEVDWEREKIIVVAGDSWHHGVLGIVASRICERYNRPAVLISFEEGVGRGSARSMGNINLYEALSFCRSELVHFGGHKMAAGLTIEKGRLSSFKEKLRVWADDNIEEASLKPVFFIDGELKPEDINDRLMDEINMLKPYGEGNEAPYFVLRRMEVASAYPVGKEQEHVKMCLNPGNLSAIAFNKPEFLGFPLDKFYHDVVFYMDYNEFKGERNIQLKVEKMKPSLIPDDPDSIKANLAAGHVILEKIWSGVEEKKPVILVYPTYRILKKHSLQLQLFFRPSFLYELHGKLTAEERERAIQSLLKGENRVFLLTQAFYEYICKKRPVGNLPAAIKIFYEEGAEVSGYYWCNRLWDKMAPRIKWRGKWQYQDRRKVLMYANKKNTLNFWKEKIPGVLVEVGEDDVRKRDYVRGIFDRLETGVLVTDGGAGRFIGDLDELVFADMPLSLYEAALVMEQIAAAGDVETVFLLDNTQLEEYDIFLRRHYPDLDIVKKVASFLFGQQVNPFYREEEKLAQDINRVMGLDLKVSEMAAVLHILNDLGLCQVRKKGSIMEIKLFKPAASRVNISDSPYYLEGLAEKRAFNAWKKKVLEFRCGDDDDRNRNAGTGKNN